MISSPPPSCWSSVDSGVRWKEEGNRFCTRGPLPALLSRGVDASEGGVQDFLDKLTDQTALRYFKGGWEEERIQRRTKKGGRKSTEKNRLGCLRRRSGEWLNFMELDLGPHLLHEERQVINEGGTTPMKKLKLLNLSTASHFLSPLTILSDILRLIWITTLATALSESFLRLKKHWIFKNLILYHKAGLAGGSCRCCFLTCCCVSDQLQWMLC